MNGLEISDPEKGMHTIKLDEQEFLLLNVALGMAMGTKPSFPLREALERLVRIVQGGDPWPSIFGLADVAARLRGEEG